jgi:hypothetical protein
VLFRRPRGDWIAVIAQVQSELDEVGMRRDEPWRQCNVEER